MSRPLIPSARSVSQLRSGGSTMFDPPTPGPASASIASIADVSPTPIPRAAAASTGSKGSSGTARPSTIASPDSRRRSAALLRLPPPPRRLRGFLPLRSLTNPTTLSKISPTSNSATASRMEDARSKKLPAAVVADCPRPSMRLPIPPFSSAATPSLWMAKRVSSASLKPSAASCPAPNSKLRASRLSAAMTAVDPRSRRVNT